jgi:hypothetical protein
MTIKHQDKYLESSPDWAMLNGCFGSIIKPEDIDGHVERGGVCLFLEHKLPNGRVNRAQDIAFDALRKQGNTAVVFWSRSPDGSDMTRMQVYYPGGPNFPEPKPATLADLRKLCSWWYKNCPAPTRRYS